MYFDYILKNNRTAVLYAGCPLLQAFVHLEIKRNGSHPKFDSIIISYPIIIFDRIVGAHIVYKHKLSISTELEKCFSLQRITKHFYKLHIYRYHLIHQRYAATSGMEQNSWYTPAVTLHNSLLHLRLHASSKRQQLFNKI